MGQNFQRIPIFTGKAINVNNPNVLSDQIPVGEGIVRAILCLNLALTIGTGSGAISEGELNILKSLTFRTDDGDYRYKNISGRALYRLNQRHYRTLGLKDAVAAATGTYRVYYILDFAHPRLARPYDTILNSIRNKSMTLEMTLGGVADLLTTVGTSTVTATIDLTFLSLKGILSPSKQPLAVYEVANIEPVNPASAQYMKLDTTDDLAYLAFMVATHNSATAGVPFSGTPASDVISSLSLESDFDMPINGMLSRKILAENKADFEFETALTGIYHLDFMQDSSIKAALRASRYGRLLLKWVNDTLSTSQVSAVSEAIRKFKDTPDSDFLAYLE